MKWKQLIATWVIGAGLIGFFWWFGWSDLREGRLFTPPSGGGWPEDVPLDRGQNVMRPMFRVIFGLIMSGLTFATVWLLTKSLLTRTALKQIANK